VCEEIKFITEFNDSHVFTLIFSFIFFPPRAFISMLCCLLTIGISQHKQHNSQIFRQNWKQRSKSVPQRSVPFKLRPTSSPKTMRSQSSMRKRWRNSRRGLTGALWCCCECTTRNYWPLSNVVALLGKIK
jgi:hypothetical protein